MSADQSNKLPVAISRAPTREELAVEEYFSKSQVTGIENIQQALTRMITLSAGLAGGSVAFLRDTLGPESQIAVAGLLITSLVIAVIGSTPTERPHGVDIQSKLAALASIRSSKQGYLHATVLVFILALVVAFCSMLYHASKAPERKVDPTATGLPK